VQLLIRNISAASALALRALAVDSSSFKTDKSDPLPIQSGNIFDPVLYLGELRSLALQTRLFQLWIIPLGRFARDTVPLFTYNPHVRLSGRNVFVKG